jgi:hypothetical protein
VCIFSCLVFSKFWSLQAYAARGKIKKKRARSHVDVSHRDALARLVDCAHDLDFTRDARLFSAQSAD